MLGRSYITADRRQVRRRRSRSPVRRTGSPTGGLDRRPSWGRRDARRRSPVKRKTESPPPDCHRSSRALNDEGEKRCTLCGYGFRRLKHLRQHLFSVHRLGGKGKEGVRGKVILGYTLSVGLSQPQDAREGRHILCYTVSAGLSQPQDAREGRHKCRQITPSSHQDLMGRVSSRSQSLLVCHPSAMFQPRST